jgi:uncharacterized protein
MFDPKNSIIRDRFSIDGVIYTNDKVRKIINTRPLQRLRFVRQNGLSSYVFPGAEHSRFAHSLGVFNVASRTFEILRRKAEPLSISVPIYAFDEYSERDFQIAALVHDIGHTAFSHALENDLLPDNFRNHEQCTVALLKSEPNLRAAISGYADIDAVIQLIDQDHANPVLNELISGPFDVDRTDYIQRDSEMCGVKYGVFDATWLAHSFLIDLDSDEVPFLSLDGPRGVEALRQFMSARRHMYRHVYFHSTIRAAQALLRAIFQRIFDLGNSSTKELTEDFKFLAKNRKPTIDEFLRISDVNVHYLIQEKLQYSNDPVLRYLASCFVNREFPKCIVDSAKLMHPLNSKYKIDSMMSRSELVQADLFPDSDKTISEVLTEVREHAAVLLDRNGISKEVANYLVTYDSCTYYSHSADSYKFRFGKNYVSPREQDNRFQSRIVEILEGKFTIERFFVPGVLVEALREFASSRYVRTNGGG